MSVFFLLLLLLCSLAGCASEPCVGEACPDACNGTDCSGDEAAPGAVGATTSGRFTSCSASSSCDEANGFACVAGTCRHPCLSHFDCGGVGVCQPLGAEGSFCALTDPPTAPGRYYSHCASGECDGAEGFTCVGSGVGDTESFCTKACTGDGDCPLGFLCDTFVNPDQTEQVVCVPRPFCGECESDGDCLSVPNGVCARNASGAKTCTTVCDPSRNSCPWGTATECLLTDDTLGVPTCQHRFGACHGEGRGCEPCVRDADCPENGICFVSTYSGERWCIDRRVPCSCAGLATSQEFCLGPDTGCPASPEGRPMACFDRAPAGGGLCFGVNLPGSSGLNAGQLSCWR